MRIRSFRKMIYDNHFSKDYLELEQKKKELESRIENYLKNNEYEKARRCLLRVQKIDVTNIGAQYDLKPFMTASEDEFDW